MRRQWASIFQKGGGVIIAAAGLIMVVKTLPFYLWPLLLGLALIWLGWRLYASSY